MKLLFVFQVSFCFARIEKRRERAADNDAIDDVLDAVDRLNSWTNLYAVKYAKQENLRKMSEKLRKQMVGKMQQCREHPKPKEQKRRMESIDVGVMEKLISPELAENVRSSFGPQNPLEELAGVNKSLTKLIKKQLSQCKRFKHFIRLRDTTMKQFSRAFLRLQKNQKERLMEISGRMQQDEYYLEESAFQEDAILAEDDLDKLEFDYADYGLPGDTDFSEGAIPDSARSLKVEGIV
ncbi:Oidioi.mRNA.OKI2018_I69.PAR.g10813.t1.cds [Oikopleura dioica]|uniref:Oidioi.mRNA.OKI2018_I69.PAR.g10813.t1.cds n=1 Tax=Oikopleura dioica TaxID=34765 RepID=A0ABN7RVV9_OIKDI|nr:Oidioi.mRNA.OKI2018_I69.PAR.g10813.t1.cds [Oikopleura dioica]